MASLYKYSRNGPFTPTFKVLGLISPPGFWPLWAKWPPTTVGGGLVAGCCFEISQECNAPRGSVICGNAIYKKITNTVCLFNMFRHPTYIFNFIQFELTWIFADCRAFGLQHMTGVSWAKFLSVMQRSWPRGLNNLSVGHPTPNSGTHHHPKHQRRVRV